MVGKPLLHGHIGWLWWLPVATFLLSVPFMAFASRRTRQGVALAGVALILGIGPTVAKLHQMEDERRYAAAVANIYPAEEGRELTVRQAAKLGWDFCYGLDKARGAPKGTAPRYDPHAFMAELTLRQVGGDSDDGETVAGMTRAVRLADEDLC